MAQHFHSAAQREQAHRIFDLVRGFNVQNIGTDAHERFLEEFYWELNIFTNLHSATLEARATLGVEGQAAVEEEARQVHAAFLEEVAQTTDTAPTDTTFPTVVFRQPRPITMLSLRTLGTDPLLFSQTRNSGHLMFPSAVERQHIESVNGQCSICAREQRLFFYS